MSITEGEAIKMLKCACVRFCSRPRRRCSAPKKGSSPVPGNSSSTAECGEKLHHIGHTTLCGDAREGRYGKGKTPGGPAGGWRKDRFINNMAASSPFCCSRVLSRLRGRQLFSDFDPLLPFFIPWA